MAFETQSHLEDLLEDFPTSLVSVEGCALHIRLGQIDWSPSDYHPHYFDLYWKYLTTMGSAIASQSSSRPAIASPSSSRPTIASSSSSRPAISPRPRPASSRSRLCYLSQYVVFLIGVNQLPFTSS